MVGNTAGATTLPLLASMPLSLLSAWAHVAQVRQSEEKCSSRSRFSCPADVLSVWLPIFLPQAAYETAQFDLAKRACRTLWNHFTYPDNGSQNNVDKLATTTGWGRNCIIIYYIIPDLFSFSSYYPIRFSVLPPKAAHPDVAALLSAPLSVVPYFHLHWDRNQHSARITLLSII